MSSSMAAPRASTSRRCEPGRHLTGTVVSTGDLTLDERHQMYALFRRYFDGAARAHFDRDLGEKERLILLRDAGSGRIKGFSTLMRMAACIDGSDLVAFFSGDTIVDRAYWGEHLLSRIWGRTVFAEADRIVAERPATAVYWFLICSGYKTWRFLPVFFRRFYPNPETPTPPHIRRVLDALASAKFGEQYVPDAGVVRLRTATPLRPGVADLTIERLRDPLVAFFARMNPGHPQGDELACLAELTRSNLTRAGQRMVRPAGAGAT